LAASHLYHAGGPPISTASFAPSSGLQPIIFAYLSTHSPNSSSVGPAKHSPLLSAPPCMFIKEQLQVTKKNKIHILNYYKYLDFCLNLFQAALLFV
jgi:hypothetical protein